MSEWKKVKIGDIFSIEKGSLQSSKCTPGEYDFITAATDWKTHNSFDHECEAIVYAGAASGSLRRAHYVNGKFIASDLCFILTEKDKKQYPINFLFYQIVFEMLRDEIVSKTKTGTSKESINRGNFSNYEIPYFPIEFQLANYQKFVNAKNIIKILLEESEKQKNYIKQLRQNILQDAIKGKLTADWRKQNSVQKGNPDYDAEALFKQIQKEKKYLLATKELKKGNLPKAIRSNKDLLKYPDSWKWARIDDLFFVTKLAGFEFTQYFHLTESGDIPVVRAQNVRDLTLNKSNLLYIDSKTSELLERSALTKPSLLVTFIGAGIGDVGIFEEKERWHLAPNVAKLEPLKNCEKLISIKLVALFMLSSFGQKEIFKYMKATAQPSLSMESIRDICFPLPPLAEQNEIVTRVENHLQTVSDLENQITKREQLTKTLMQSILRDAFEEK